MKMHFNWCFHRELLIKIGFSPALYGEFPVFIGGLLGVTGQFPCRNIKLNEFKRIYL